VTRIDQLIVDMEHGAQKIFNLAWDLEKDGKLVIRKAEVAWPSDLRAAAVAPAPGAAKSGAGKSDS
jgi:hypothetical protein